jgi:hypothetical protein
MASALLKDSNECERLADTVLLSLFSRYTEANDIASASDTNEVNLSDQFVVCRLELYCWYIADCINFQSCQRKYH